jgi:hypothetical protein
VNINEGQRLAELEKQVPRVIQPTASSMGSLAKEVPASSGAKGKGHGARLSEKS